jgi:hypothetical protein
MNMNGSSTTAPAVISDPVGHISISGVHGGEELQERLVHASHGSPPDARGAWRTLFIGLAAGVAIGMLIGRGRRRRGSSEPLTTP